jgi:hypothetical protein
LTHVRQIFYFEGEESMHYTKNILPPRKGVQRISLETESEEKNPNVLLIYFLNYHKE